MRIGIISDTHIPSMGDAPPPQVRTAFAGVDRILHGGDVYVQSCLDWLAEIAPVDSVNSGRLSTAEAAPRVSPPAVVEVAGRKIGMMHNLELTTVADDVYPGTLGRVYRDRETLERDLSDTFGERVDIVVCGYTHDAMVEEHHGVLFINPGSPTMVGQVMRMGTVAVLELDDDGGAHVEVVRLADIEA